MQQQPSSKGNRPRHAPVIIEVDYCLSELKILHETFTCHDDKGHALPHASITMSPCPVCKGMDQHSDTCDNSYDTSGTFVTLEWDDDGNWERK